jgi:hypothetical protein
VHDGGNKEFIWNDEYAELLGISNSKFNDLELSLLKDLVCQITCNAFMYFNNLFLELEYIRF